MDYLNDFESWVHGSRSYKQFRDVANINGTVLWAQGCRYYEQVKVMDDMNDLGSRDLRPLDAMNSSGLWKNDWLHVVSYTNNLRLLMTWITQDYELWALDVKNNLAL